MCSVRSQWGKEETATRIIVWINLRYRQVTPSSGHGSGIRDRVLVESQTLTRRLSHTSPKSGKVGNSACNELWGILKKPQSLTVWLAVLALWPNDFGQVIRALSFPPLWRGRRISISECGLWSSNSERKIKKPCRNERKAFANCGVYKESDVILIHEALSFVTWQASRTGDATRWLQNTSHVLNSSQNHSTETDHIVRSSPTSTRLPALSCHP